MSEIEVKLAFVEGADPFLDLPEYETQGAAAMDLRANFLPEMRKNGLCLVPGARALIPTGISIEIPVGFEAQIRPRSGLAHKHGLTVLNTPGTIDCDYRGPLGIILVNHGSNNFTVGHGDRIAQILFAPVVRAKLKLVKNLELTERASGGFGSTGLT